MFQGVSLTNVGIKPLYSAIGPSYWIVFKKGKKKTKSLQKGAEIFHSAARLIHKSENDISWPFHDQLVQVLFKCYESLFSKLTHYYTEMLHIVYKNVSHEYYHPQNGHLTFQPYNPPIIWCHQILLTNNISSFSHTDSQVVCITHVRVLYNWI